jgi:hypothetical protein
VTKNPSWLPWAYFSAIRAADPDDLDPKMLGVFLSMPDPGTRFSTTTFRHTDCFESPQAAVVAANDEHKHRRDGGRRLDRGRGTLRHVRARAEAWTVKKLKPARPVITGPQCFLVADRPLVGAPYHPVRAVIQVTTNDRSIDFEGFTAAVTDRELKAVIGRGRGFPERFANKVKAAARKQIDLPWRRFSIVNVPPRKVP